MKELIKDIRLTADLKLIRGGSTMYFFKPENKSIQTRDADIVIKAPRPELKAKLIDGEWYWINDCPECNGQAPQWAYAKCDKHNVCVTCHKPRKDIKGTVWGHKKGFRCVPCQEIINAAKRQEALERVASKEYDEWDYVGQDTVKCPHCASTYEPDCDTNGGEETCEICGGVYSLEVEYTASYTTKVVGERQTL